MIDLDAAQAALVAVRDLISADGGDIEVIDVGADQVRLRLLLDNAECRECVMPRSFLETVALSMMKADLADLTTVSIDDPRESA